MDANERFVYLCLANHSGAEGSCFPSLPTIARETRLSESTVRRSIQALEKGGYLTVIRGSGAGHRSEYQLLKKVPHSNPSNERVPQRKVSVRQKKGVTQTEKGCQPDKSPTPPIRSNRQGTVSEPSAGASGELMAAGFLFQELGIAAGSYDVQMLAQVISFAARDGKTDAEQATKFLLQAAQDAMKRGEVVNTFWFKDRKFANGGSNGTSHRSPASQRIHDNRLALAKAAIKRGWIRSDQFTGGGAETVAEPRPAGDDRGISGGLRAVDPEILPPRRAGSDGGIES